MDSISSILSTQTNNFFPSGQSSVSQPNPPDASRQIEQKPDSSAMLPRIAEKNQNLEAIKAGLQSLKIQLDAILELIDDTGKTAVNSTLKQARAVEIPRTLPENSTCQERILEGTFNGEKMIGNDGKEYSVPPNYASKSKLVDGDQMKLTITQHGSFIYKQISQVARIRLSGTLIKDEISNQWKAQSQGRLYRILTASVTFYRGRPGDEVFFLTTKEKISGWGAVEHIVINE